MNRLLGRTGLLLLLQAGISLFLVAGRSPSAEIHELSVPYEIHVPLLLKLVSKNRSLPGKLHDEVVIAVAGPRSFAAVREIADGKQLLGRRIRVVRVRNSSPSPDIIYVGPDTNLPVDRLCALASRSGAITVTGVSEFVERGVALGVKLSPSRRPKIMVNLGAAKEEGVDLPAAILSIAEVIER